MAVRGLVLGALVVGCSFPSLRFVDADGGGAVDVVEEVRTEDVPRLDAGFDAARAVDVVMAVDVPIALITDVVEGYAPSRSCPRLDAPGCSRVLVQGGRYAMGQGGTTYAPVQAGVSVSGFVVDATEVTVGRFRRFVEAMATDTMTTQFSAAYPSGVTLTVDRAGLPSPLFASTSNCNGPTAGADASLELHPVSCIAWETAFAFCVWDGGRLPTEAEQEYLARWWQSPTGRAWPWGEGEATCEHVHWRVSPMVAVPCVGDDGRSTRRVGALAMGAFGGVYDLAGNVSEWSADRYERYASTTAPNGCWGARQPRDPLCASVTTTERTVRGGNWLMHEDGGEGLRAYARSRVDSQTVSPVRGVRCVRGP